FRFWRAGPLDSGSALKYQRLHDHFRSTPFGPVFMADQSPALCCIICGSAPPGSHQAIAQHLADAIVKAGQSNAIAFVAAGGGNNRTTNNGVGLIRLAGGPDLAVVTLIAREGVTAKTWNECLALQVMGVRHVIFAILSSDGNELNSDRYETLAADCRKIAKGLTIEEPLVVPLALPGGGTADWYNGAPLSGCVLRLAVSLVRPLRPMRVIIDAAGSGRAVNGRLAVGDRVAVLPAGRVSQVAALIREGQSLDTLETGETAGVTLTDGTPLNSGDVLAQPEQRPEIADQLAAHIVWAAEDPLLPGRPYRMQCGGQSATASVSTLKYKINSSNLEHVAARQLEKAETGFCNLSISRPIVFDPFEMGGETGQFTLSDTVSGETVGAGLIRFGLRRAENVHWQALSIDKTARATAKLQQPCCLWFTGLSGSGKSTIANLLERKLHSTGRHTYILDGDNVRHGLNRDLGFADADRVENIRRVAEVAKLMVDAGLIVIVSFISPFRAERRMARELFQSGEFLEVFVETPIEVCEARDPKGLYAKARQGLIRNFTGIDSDYELPEAPELRLDTTTAEPADLAERLLAELGGRGVV
ncbi:MAG: adenylyl-sulfate kinase, partial [Hyphomicrobium sp.]